MMHSKVLYSDALVEITQVSIRFRAYYFPGWDKVLPLSGIDKILILEPTLKNGKWRIWGSGNLKTWFPPDIKRFKREKIFLIQFKESSRQIGFTVEDWKRVVRVLAELQITVDDHSKKKIPE